jgi:hypothetical protein
MHPRLRARSFSLVLPLRVPLFHPVHPVNPVKILSLSYPKKAMAWARLTVGKSSRKSAGEALLSM